MVFGIVLGFLEGRRETEALTAGLCASFILAGGVTKSLGAWLVQLGVSELWMPATAGAIFLLPLFGFVGLLSRLPPPTGADILARSRREPLNRSGRRELARRYHVGLLLIVIVYTIVTILRSIRDDFAPELFKGLGTPASPSAFATNDLTITIAILLISGSSFLIRNNRLAFFVSLAICIFGCLVLLGATLAVWNGLLGAFAFMALAGLGLYIPYVMIHTTVFERLLATTRDVGNIAFLMYIADAFGYLGYVGVMLGRGWLSEQSNESLATFFIQICFGCAVCSAILLTLAARYFARKLPADQSQNESPNA